MVIFTKKFWTLNPHLPIVWDKVPKKTFFFWTPSLTGDMQGKWACKDEGEPEAWVILQLEEMSIISDLDLGNNGAAFIEVQVGRLGMEVKDYQTLLVASSFMSPGEARLGDKATRVRMFSSDQFSATVAKEKWDMVKVVATQPFTKHSR